MSALSHYRATPAPNVDGRAVSKAIARFAHSCGCDETSLLGAINYGLLHGTDDLDAARKGRRRAMQLAAMQPKGVA